MSKTAKQHFSKSAEKKLINLHMFSVVSLARRDIFPYIKTEQKKREQKVPQKNLNSILHLPEFLFSVNVCNLYVYKLYQRESGRRVE